MRVVIRCFSHSMQRSVTGPAAKRLRELFFPGECKDSFENLMHSIMDMCSGASFVRLDGFVWKARNAKPWIYNKVDAYEDFVNTYFKSHQVFMKNPRKFADVIKCMETVDHESFPFVKRNVDYIGFDNCLVNIVTYEVITSFSDPARIAFPATILRAYFHGTDLTRHFLTV